MISEGFCLKGAEFHTALTAAAECAVQNVINAENRQAAILTQERNFATIWPKEQKCFAPEQPQKCGFL